MTFVCSIRLCLARFDSWFYTFFNWWDILEFSVERISYRLSGRIILGLWQEFDTFVSLLNEILCPIILYY